MRIVLQLRFVYLKTKLNATNIQNKKKIVFYEVASMNTIKQRIQWKLWTRFQLSADYRNMGIYFKNLTSPKLVHGHKMKKSFCYIYLLYLTSPFIERNMQKKMQLKLQYILPNCCWKLLHFADLHNITTW